MRFTYFQKNLRFLFHVLMFLPSKNCQNCSESKDCSNSRCCYIRAITSSNGTSGSCTGRALYRASSRGRSLLHSGRSRFFACIIVVLCWSAAMIRIGRTAMVVIFLSMVVIFLPMIIGIRILTRSILCLFIDVFEFDCRRLSGFNCCLSTVFSWKTIYNSG